MVQFYLSLILIQIIPLCTFLEIKRSHELKRMYQGHLKHFFFLTKVNRLQTYKSSKWFHISCRKIKKSFKQKYVAKEMMHLNKERIIMFVKNIKQNLFLLVHLLAIHRVKNNKVDCNQHCLVSLRKEELALSGPPSCFLSSGAIILSLFYRYTYASWTMRCRIQMNAKGILWLCMMEAVLLRI